LRLLFAKNKAKLATTTRKPVAVNHFHDWLPKTSLPDRSGRGNWGYRHAASSGNGSPGCHRPPLAPDDGSPPRSTWTHLQTHGPLATPGSSARLLTMFSAQAASLDRQFSPPCPADAGGFAGAHAEGGRQRAIGAFGVADARRPSGSRSTKRPRSVLRRFSDPQRGDRAGAHGNRRDPAPVLNIVPSRRKGMLPVFRSES